MLSRYVPSKASALKYTNIRSYGASLANIAIKKQTFQAKPENPTLTYTSTEIAPLLAIVNDLVKVDGVIDNIEKHLEHELSIEATVHMDPIVTDDETVDHLKDIAKRAVLVIDDRFKIHDFRCVVGQTHTNLIFDVVVPFEVKMSDSDICRKIEEAVRLADSNFNTVVTVDRA